MAGGCWALSFQHSPLEKLRAVARSAFFMLSVGSGVAVVPKRK
jgi:hypothetical protein